MSETIAEAPALGPQKRRRRGPDEKFYADTLQPLLRFLRSLGPSLGLLAGFSAAVNILMLVAPIYMLQVYDRVLTSGSFDTLLWLTLIATFLLVVYAAAEAGRRRVAAIALEQLDARASRAAFARFHGKGPGDLAGELMVAARVRPLLQGQLIFPFLDLPFAPLFLLILFLIHPVVGFVGLSGAALVLAVAVLSEAATRKDGADAGTMANELLDYAAALSSRRSSIVSMGMGEGVYRRWLARKEQSAAAHLDVAETEGVYASASRSMRQVLQILVLAVGAGLAIAQEISPGAIVAASIILARALQPIDQIVGSWRGLVQASAAARKMQALEDGEAMSSDFTPLPRPAAELIVDRLAVSAAANAQAFLIRPFTIRYQGGIALAVVGANGCGKSSLLATLAGAAAPAAGAVTLGGRSLHDWPSADRGRHVGYLAQEVELLPGTIAENIARFTEADPEAVFRAARLAGAHEMILALPKAYETRVGPGGARLSVGQERRIGLARAFFGDPLLLLLDEPTANLDAASAAQTVASIAAAAKQGAIVIAATHDRALIAATQSVLAIKGGSMMTAESAAFLRGASGATGSPIAIASAGGDR